MHHHQASRTAEYMAFFRATESLRPEGQRLFYDPLADCFVRPSLKKALTLSRFPALARLVNWYADRRLPGARTSAIARTKFIDDAFRSALREGITQVVILGAGFDCRAYRLAAVATATVFEVDHPATLAAKLSLLRPALSHLPENIRYVEVDFNRQFLPSILLSAGLANTQPAVFLWEGVTNYLATDAVDSVLSFVSSFASGSQLIFTYVDAGLLNGTIYFEGGSRLLRDVAELGEPWTFGLDPAHAAEFLQRHNFSLVCDLSAAQYRAKYFGAAAATNEGIRVLSRSRCACPSKR